MASQSKLMGDRTIKSIIQQLTAGYLKNRKNISRAVYLTLFITLINRIRNAINEQKAASLRQAESRRRGGTTSGDVEKEKRRKVELNREFFKNLGRLLKIVIPGWRSTEMRLLISHSFFLVVRTMLSLYVADLDGKLVSSLVRGKGKDFLKGIVWWMVVAVPATFTNSMASSSLLCASNESEANLYRSSPITNVALLFNTAAVSQITSTTNTFPT